MKQYDVKCPVCGTLNKGLYLDETNGWMICEHCGSKVLSSSFDNREVAKLPVYDINNLPAFSKRIAV